MSKAKSRPCRHPESALVWEPAPSFKLNCKKCGAKDVSDCPYCNAGIPHDECAGEAS